jgi:hypothetical protein
MAVDNMTPFWGEHAIGCRFPQKVSVPSRNSPALR